MPKKSKKVAALYLPPEKRPLLEKFKIGSTIQRLRKNIGVTTKQMAELLGLSGKNAATELRKYERGVKQPTRPVKLLLNYILQGTRRNDRRDILPEYTIASNLTRESPLKYVYRNEYPRFIAVLLKVDPDLLTTDDPVEILFNDFVYSNERDYCFKIISWIDKPIGDKKQYMKKGVQLFEDHKIK